MITVDVVIDKATMKDLLNCNQNKDALAIILATQLIECKKDSQMMYVVNSKVIPFGRKPRYVAGCPTVDLELVQTTRNVNGTRHSVRKFQPGKRDHLFRFSTFSANFPVGRTDETCSIYRRTGNSGNFD